MRHPVKASLKTSIVSSKTGVNLELAQQCRFFYNSKYAESNSENCTNDLNKAKQAKFSS